MLKQRWVAMTSHNGIELKNVIKGLDRSPDLILTDNKEVSFKHFKTPWVSGSPDELFKALEQMRTKFFVTLHDYDNTISNDICNKYSVFNSFAGDILNYPELKDFVNPRQKVIDLGHQVASVVLYKMSDNKNNGTVLVSSTSRNIVGMTEPELKTALCEDTVKTWIEFLSWSMKF